MKDFDPGSMSVDELWAVHEQVHDALFNKINSEKLKLESQLSRLNASSMLKQTQKRAPEPVKSETGRRPYPKVLAKYRNPEDPSETWAGRGKQPRWLVTQLSRGRKLEDFAINAKRGSKRAKRSN